MRKSVCFIAIVIPSLTMLSFGCGKNGTEPDPEPNTTELTGEYLGQQPPGTIPVRFAPTLLLASGSRWWHDSPAFSPDGQELYMSLYDTEYEPSVSIDFMRVESDFWTFPQIASFSGEYRDNGARFSQLGDRLYFTSRRPGGAVFVVTRADGVWSAPDAVNIPGSESPDFIGISVTGDETIYYGDYSSGSNDIYRSRFANGQYTQPENLGAAINTDSEEWGPYIDPDEDFIIFASDRPGGFGLHDLYISFRDTDGSWKESENMGSSINSNNEDFAPLISPDGDYLFYLTEKEGDLGSNPYWVDAQIIENFRPEGGGVIAFCSDRDGDNEIYLMSTDGSNVQQLTFNTAEEWAPAWSPDGSQIAFASNREGDYEIYVMNADGSNVQRLTNNPAEDHGSAWSPDGTEIIFWSDRDGDREIYIINVDGSELQKITDNTIVDTSPDWSPDGTRITFHSDQNGGPDILVMNVDGGNRQALTNSAGRNFLPDWSPDNTQIVFESDRHGPLELYIMNADGGSQQRLTYTDSDNHEPDWSPAGTQIAFVSYQNDNYEILIIDADGTDLHNITNHTANDFGPAWLPEF